MNTSPPRPGAKAPSAHGDIDEERWSRHLTVTQEAFIEVSVEGEISYWSACAERLFGWSITEAIGRKMDDLILNQSNLSAPSLDFENCVAMGALGEFTRTFEATALHRDGRFLPIDISINAMPPGHPIALCASIRDTSQRCSAAQAIRLAEVRYQTFTEHAAEGMIVITNERIVYANNRTAEICGRSREELETLGILDCVHPADHVLVGERHRRRLAGEEVPKQYEIRLILPDGIVRWVSLSVALSEWEGERGTLAFLTDITDRRSLEEKLRNSLVERETILEHSLVGIALLSSRSAFQWSNGAMEKIFGQTRGVAAPKDWSVLFASPAEFVRISKEIARCFIEGKSYQSELQMRKLDGSLFWVAASGKRVNVVQENSPSVWAVMDITPRKTLEENLKRASSEREAIFGSALVGIFFAIDGKMQWVNAKFSEMMGYSESELVGQSARVFYVDDVSFEALGNDSQKSLLRHGTYITERPMLCKSGAFLWVQIAGRCLTDRKPEFGVIWTLLDITERLKAEDEIRIALAREKDLNHLRSQFFSATSHEFRTPLAAILSASELLRDYNDRMPNHDRTEILGSIAAGVQRMTSLLDRVQLLGQVDTHMLVFNPQKIDLAALCHTIVEETQDLHPQAYCTVLTRFAPQPEGKEFDPDLLRHILGNILSNAIKYSASGGQVTFSISNSADRVVFEVEDHGIGIPLQDMDNLFETFHRASNVGHAQGAGLGLAIVKKSVALHGGTIEVQSTLGSRTRFTVTL